MKSDEKIEEAGSVQSTASYGNAPPVCVDVDMQSRIFREGGACFVGTRMLVGAKVGLGASLCY
jgi:hypothetical protein